MIDIEKMQEKYEADFIRFYLCYKVQDNIKDFKIKKKDFIQVINNVLISKIINLNYRIFNIIKNCKTIPNIENEDKEFLELYINKIYSLIENCQINTTVKLICKFIDECNIKMSNFEFRDISKKQNIVKLISISALIYILLKPIAPKIAQQICIFENWTPQTINDVFKCESQLLKKTIDKIENIS